MAMDVDVLMVPFDSARRGERMGAGPDALMRAGLVQQVEQHGGNVRCVVVEPPIDSWTAEIRSAFDLAAAVAAQVSASRLQGRFPLVLAGNCGAAIGVVAALGAGTRTIWADAHADFNTPETTTTGFLDGMSLATLTGRCWTTLANQIAGFVPVADENVLLIGARDLDPPEMEALKRSKIRRVAAAQLKAATIDQIVRQSDSLGLIYLHIDLDVIDSAEGCANTFAAAGGVSSAQLTEFCTALYRHSPPAAMTISAYDPAADGDGNICRAALRIVSAIFGVG